MIRVEMTAELSYRRNDAITYFKPGSHMSPSSSIAGSTGGYVAGASAHIRTRLYFYLQQYFSSPGTVLSKSSFMGAFSPISRLDVREV